MANVATNTNGNTQRQTVAHAQQPNSATEQALESGLPSILEDLLTTTASSRSKLKPTDKYRLLKSQIAPGCTDDELALFLEVAQMRGLDPFAKQIYAIRRKSRAQDERGNWIDVWKMTIQTGIDGFRLIASRKDPHYTTDDTVFEYDADARSQINPLGIVRATVRIWKSGATRAVEASAYWDEYRQAADDRNNGGKRLTGKWADMPRNQIGKCAEALVLRKAFPEDLSGLYTDDEMDQAENERSVETLMPHVAAQAQAQAPTPTNPATPSLRATKPGNPIVETMIREIGACTTVDALFAWNKKNEPAFKRLADAEYDRVGDVFKARDAELATAAAAKSNAQPSSDDEAATAGGGR